MRKTISWLITLTIILGICPVMAVNAAWDGQAATALQGSGKSASDPYLIGTAAELKYASILVNEKGETSAYFKLTADIDYENNEWIPFAHNGSINYSGTFDGDGYVVKNLKITDSSISRKGFFGQLNGSTIKNLGVDNMTISISDTANGHRMGALVCRASGTITNCYVKNSTVHHTGASGEEYGVAGFVGSTRIGTTISNCYVYGTDVKGCGRHVGAFLGQMEHDGTVSNCYVANTTVTNTAGKPTYAFGNTQGKTVSGGNNHSTLTSMGDADLAPTPSSEDAIVNGLVAFDANCAYKVNSKINNGYPCMSYQKAAAYDNEYEVAMFTDADGIKVRIEENEAVADAVVYVATYDNDGRLIAAEALDVDTIVTSTLSTAGVKTIKVFVWDASNNSLALAKVINK